MRVGVIRGDMPGPIEITDLEPVSRYNPSTEPEGQERRLGRPDLVAIQAFLNKLGFNASAATLVAAASPVDGPLDVSNTKIKSVSGLSGATNPQCSMIADLIAPHFIETDVLIKSFQVGNLYGFRQANYNPDPRHFPSIANKPAIAVVMDDGVTPYSAPLTVISSAVHDTPNAGDLRINGTNLANPEFVTETVIKISAANTNFYVRIPQQILVATFTGGTHGSVSPTQITIPASLLKGLGVAGSKVIVKFTSLVSNVAVVT